MPIIFTGVPTGPEVSLSPMIGFRGGEDVTVNVAESELNPSLAVTVSGPGIDLKYRKVSIKVSIIVSWAYYCCWIRPKVMITLEFGAKLVPRYAHRSIKRSRGWTKFNVTRRATCGLKLPSTT